MDIGIHRVTKIEVTKTKVREGYCFRQVRIYAKDSYGAEAKARLVASLDLFADDVDGLVPLNVEEE